MNTHTNTALHSEMLRVTIAMRRDRLVARQRRGYSPKRQELIDQLGRDYRAVLSMALDAGIERL